MGQGATSKNSDDIYVIKVSQLGDTICTKLIGTKGFDSGYSIKQTSDKGYIIAGQTSSTLDGNDACLVKLSENGEVIWSKTVGGSGDERVNQVEITKSNEFVFLGFTTTGSNNSWGNVYLIKTNLSGDTIWTRTLSC